jgi:hypothetical protein
MENLPYGIYFTFVCFSCVQMSRKRNARHKAEADLEWVANDDDDDEEEENIQKVCLSTLHGVNAHNFMYR